MGVPPPPGLGTCAHRRWHYLGRPWRRHALVRRERPEDVRLDSVLAGPGGGTVLVRLLGADHHSLRICLNLSLRYSHEPDTAAGELAGSLLAVRDVVALDPPGLGQRPGVRRSAEVAKPGVSGWSGRRESNPHDQLGRLRLAVLRTAAAQVRACSPVTVSSPETPSLTFRSGTQRARLLRCERPLQRSELLTAAGRHGYEGAHKSPRISVSYHPIGHPDGHAGHAGHAVAGERWPGRRGPG